MRVESVELKRTGPSAGPTAGRLCDRHPNQTPLLSASGRRLVSEIDCVRHNCGYGVLINHLGHCVAQQHHILVK